VARGFDRGSGRWVMATAKPSKSDVHREIQQTFGSVPEWVTEIPDVALLGFWTLFRDMQLAETRIPNKYKELIGIAVSGATRCRYCVLFHTEAARLHGATDEEIAEASMMAGVSMMASTFLNAQAVDHDRFRKDTLDAIAYARRQMGPSGGAKKAAAHA
jgi:AhpD family alkylhydroperoxidase